MRGASIMTSSLITIYCYVKLYLV